MSADPNDRASIEREIRQRQEHLASTVDELTDRVAPKAVAQRTAASAQAKARAAVLDEDGAVRVGRVGAVGGGLVALLGAIIWRKSR